MVWTYIIIAVLLLAAELLYFKIADKCNIIDKPNERSSHTTIVLRGGGIIFTLSMIAWAVLMVVQGNDIVPYLPFLVGLIMIATVSFWDDVHSLPDSLGDSGTGSSSRGYKYPKYVESDRGLNQSVAEVA